MRVRIGVRMRVNRSLKHAYKVSYFILSRRRRARGGCALLDPRYVPRLELIAKKSVNMVDMFT